MTRCHDPSGFSGKELTHTLLGLSHSRKVCKNARGRLEVFSPARPCPSVWLVNPGRQTRVPSA